ncbi:MAG: hypothetical protein HWN66_16370 [Candidatus Helarchaeota archaeon]|nr:hypothetical protein [Candidatus Helarchaeota archaeon]
MTINIKDFPKPNFSELPDLYDDLDQLAIRIINVITSLNKKLYDSLHQKIYFNKMSKEDLKNLISNDPDALVPAFVKNCGLSIREFERLYGIKNIYKLRNPRRWDPHLDRDAKKLIDIISSLFENLELSLETFLYTFYKMWEADEKRHYRAKKAEEQVKEFFRRKGYNCDKVTNPVELDAAIPPSSDPKNVLVGIPIRTGVRRDLVKRAKEYSSEFDDFRDKFPNAKIIIVFRIPQHELENKEGIRHTINAQREGKESYDCLVFQDELDIALQKLEEWKIPKKNKNHKMNNLTRWLKKP